MMRVYLTQHGLALTKELDVGRPLSEQGRTDVRRLARFLASAQIRVEQVLHSGKTRAEQTAALLAEGLVGAGPPRARPGLDPNDPVEPLAAEIGNWSADTLLVGHLPFLARLASLLLASDQDRQLLGFEPGCMACIERGPGGDWVLLWMIRPELLAAGLD